MFSLPLNRNRKRPQPSRRRGHVWLLGLLGLMIALPPMLQFPGSAIAANLPAGFRDEIVADMDRPTAMAFAPGGLLLVTEKAGQLWVVDRAGKAETPALDLGPTICTNRNRGLLGVAVDPAFAQNRAIYLFYTFNKFMDCPVFEDYGPTNPVSRVSRFALGDDNVVDPDSERVLLEGIVSYSAGNHDGGDLGFGKDGFLYISVGDGDCDLADIEDGGEVTRCQGENPNAQQMNLLYGKILRITRDGNIPRDNPYVGNGTARCNGDGRAPVGRTCQEIFASGFRNPFRIAFDQNAKTTRLFINDVGNDVSEEVNAGKAGANYGYNRREGFCLINSGQDCQKRNPPRGLTNPIYAYRHTTGCESITGGAFSPAKSDWPAKYRGDYFYADVVCGKIFRLSQSNHGIFRPTLFAGDFGGFSLIDLAFGPADLGQPNGDRALYYATFQDGAAIRRIAFGKEAAPTADGGTRAAEEAPTDRRDRARDEELTPTGDEATDQQRDTTNQQRDRRNDRSDQADGGADRGDAEAAPPKSRDRSG